MFASDPLARLFEDDTPYKIPIIEYTEASQRQIHEVFNLYNKQGKHLNAEEIRNAIFHELKLTRGLLVAAGDADQPNAVEEIAPFLAPKWDELKPLSEALKNYGFGVGRYRRTKVLSWILATLVFDSTESGWIRPCVDGGRASLRPGVPNDLCTRLRHVRPKRSSPACR